MWRRSRAVGLALVLIAVVGTVAGGCSDRGDDAAPARTTPTTRERATSTTAAPTTTTTTTTVAAKVAPVRPAPAQPATTGAPFACPAVPARSGPLPDRPSYKWTLRFDLANGFVEGQGRLAFTPEADTDRVVVRLWANSPRITRGGGRIEASADGAIPVEQPDASTLVLKTPVRAGQRFETGMAWHLTLPTAPTDDRVFRSGDTVRLGSFLPVVAWEPGRGWATDPPTSGFAEASTMVPADFDVTVTGLPEGVTALATGVHEGGDASRWLASGVPDWAMSTGRFTLASRDVGGIAVTVGVDSQVAESPARYLDRVAGALDDFGRRFGPYPWPTYTLAITPALRGGIEGPMHVMQGPNTIGRTTSHEVGHMWFYGLVPTNQGRDPWIDEGLATWAEGRFEGSTARLMGTSIPSGGRGRAGEPMTFWESRQSIYYRSVYVQGAQAVGALGAPDAVDCALRQLVARQAYRVTRPADVIAALSSVFPNAAEVLGRYGIRA